MQSSGVCDVLHDASAYNCTVLEALGDEPGEVDGGVDADGCEVCAAIHAWGELVFGKNAEVGQDIFEPGVFSDEFAEPVSHGAVGVFLAAVDEVVCLRKSMWNSQCWVVMMLTLEMNA